MNHTAALAVLFELFGMLLLIIKTGCRGISPSQSTPMLPPDHGVSLDANVSQAHWQQLKNMSVVLMLLNVSFPKVWIATSSTVTKTRYPSLHL